MFVLFPFQSHVASEPGEAEDNDLAVFWEIRWRRFVLFLAEVEVAHLYAYSNDGCLHCSCRVLMFGVFMFWC